MLLPSFCIPHHLIYDSNIHQQELYVQSIGRKRQSDGDSMGFSPLCLFVFLFLLSSGILLFASYDYILLDGRPIDIEGGPV